MERSARCSAAVCVCLRVQVFTPEAGQTALFEQVQPLVTSVLDGYNVCIFAYGQTGSGKTHTMEGPAADPGIYQRSLQELFKLVAERDTFVESKVSVNLLEIYNEQVGSHRVAVYKQKNTQYYSTQCPSECLR